MTAIAQPVSGSVVLGFRQGNGNSVGGSTATPGDSFNITGYYFQIDPATNTYSIYQALTPMAASTRWLTPSP